MVGWCVRVFGRGGRQGQARRARRPLPTPSPSAPLYLEPRRGPPVQQRVLQLEVAVAHALGVAVLDAAHKLLEKKARLVLGEAAGAHDAVEEFAA